MTFTPGQTVYHQHRSHINRVDIVEKVEGCLNLYHVKDAAPDMLVVEYHAQEKDLFPSELEANQAALSWLNSRVACVQANIAKHSETL